MVSYGVTNRKNVRILLVGDPGVGKTSLILSLVSEQFPEEVPPKAEEITIPANVIPEQVPTNIVDYSSSEQSEDSLNEEIRKAHVVCVVYAVNDDQSLDRVTSHWLPLIRKLTEENQPWKPIILVGNKVDLVDFSTMHNILDTIDQFPEVESCVECSAKTLKNISELFYYAQKAVLHPTSPLYVMEDQDLTPLCKKCLTRIFKICDIDGDNLLNDYELNLFQRRCFNTPLQPQILDEVKAVIEKNAKDSIHNESVTLKGFLFMHCLFIQRGRSETTWAVLRRFGYNEKLEISKDYLKPILKIPPGSSTELSHRGQQFLIALFERYDRDGDGALSPEEHKHIFSICPQSPWSYSSDIRKSCPVNEMGWITLNGWMCRWTLMALLDIQKTMEYLAYLGFNVQENDSQLAAVHVTREKRIDLAKRHSSRSVYMCHVIGTKGSGKTALCRALLAKDTSTLLNKEFKTKTVHCINTVQIYGQEKYLVMRDLEAKPPLEPLQPQEINCDVACLVYNVADARSFEYIARIYIKYFAESKTPVIIVGTKSDLEICNQEYLLQPKEFCHKYKLLPPHLFSLKTNKKELFVKLTTMAAFPHFRQFGLISEDPTIWWKAGLGVAAATLLGFVVLRTITGISSAVR